MAYFGECYISISLERVGLSSRSCFPAFVFYFMLSYFCLSGVSLCFPFFLFVDVFQFAMWSTLQAEVPRDDHHLRSLADSPPDVTLAGRASSTVTKYSATYARWKRWARDQGGSFSCVSLSLHSLFASFDGGSQDCFSHRVCRSCYCLGSPIGWGAISFRAPVSEGCSCWATASFGSPGILPRRILLPLHN